MDQRIGRQLAALERLTAKELRQRYLDVFGEETAANNKVWLLRRIAWRLQARAEGDLTDRARQRAAELADDADLRRNPPVVTPAAPDPTRTLTTSARFPTDERLPPAGTILTRTYKGVVLQVKVLADGFEFDGQRYGSLSAVAKAVTGTHCNGYLFFRLAGHKGATS